MTDYYGKAAVRGIAKLLEKAGEDPKAVMLRYQKHHHDVLPEFDYGRVIEGNSLEGGRRRKAKTRRGRKGTRRRVKSSK